MVFSSIEFLFLFLPLVLLIYHVTPKAGKNTVLLVASLLFYIWGGGAFVLLLIASIVVDYVAGLIVARGVEQDRAAYRRLGIALSVAVNLSLLGYFKYANFVVYQLNLLGESIGAGEIAWTSVLLPIGISFYTFQSMSYTLDVARGRCEARRNPLDLGLFVALFPQLIAGPIVRYHELAAQIRSRRVKLDDLAQGGIRFAHGLFKKVVIADTLAAVAEAAFAQPGADLTTATAWIGILAFWFQLYFDFSGYSDMAIGLGRMFGFRFPENFRRPYSAVSVADFWQRWHMTLTRWLRDYFYFPLARRHRKKSGRNNVLGVIRAHVDLLVLFLVVGLWHGASWTFLAFGAYWGIALVVERLLNQNVTQRANHVFLRRLAMLPIMFFSAPLFRSDSLDQAWAFYEAMIAISAAPLAPQVALTLTNQVLVAFTVAVATLFLPRTFVGGVFLSTATGAAAATARILFLTVALPYTLILVASRTFSPFLYFQF